MVKNYQHFARNFFQEKKGQSMTCFGKKKLKGRAEELETWHEETLDPVLKKARKQQIPPGSPSL